MKKWAKIIIFSLIIICLIFFVILIIKHFKNGNNMSNKSQEEIEQYILNIDSYEAEVEIEVNTNKNKNKYKAKQKYVKENNLYTQEILEPENIKGTVITYDGTNLKLENTKLNLNKIYENYNYIGSNDLSLSQFVADYNESNEKSINEKNGIIIMEAKIKNGNKYRAVKKLYINKKDVSPKKMEIQDITREYTSLHII